MAIASGRLDRDEGSDVGFEERIDPELRDGLVLYQALGFEAKDLSGETLATMRTTSAALFAEAMADVPANDRVVRQDRTAPGPGGEVPVRVHRSVDATGTLPALLWIHGGGMIFGNIDQDDLACDAYAEAVGCVVVNVEYRLAPEHPHPAPVEDCYAALRWMADNAAELGIDPARIAVGGASAGGGLAAGTVLMARDRGGPDVAFQLLVYPMLDDRDATPSAQEFGGALSWGREHNVSGWKAYLGDRIGTDAVDHYAAPARATDLSGLPPALIQVGELETFRDEDIDYAARLLRAGVPTQLHVYPGAFHAWDMAAPAGAPVRADGRGARGGAAGRAAGPGRGARVITCHVRYEIVPEQLDAFERFAQRWMELVARHGGIHHGYFLPAEGASDIAYALFSFPSLAEYERYRERFGVDPDFIDADRIRDESGCVRRYERSFLRPLLP